MAIYQFRQRKDDFFATDPNSPIEGRGFTGLRYYPWSPDCIVAPALEPFPEDGTVNLVTSVGDEPCVSLGLRLCWGLPSKP